MIYYKLTDRAGNTKHGMHWGVGKTNRAVGKGKALCTDGYLHVYDTPEQAAFMRPSHVPTYSRLFKVKSRNKGITDGTKRGIKSCTVLEEVELPELTVEQQVEIAIRASLLADTEEKYVRWARAWISGKDRSADAAAGASDKPDMDQADKAYAACAAYLFDAVWYAAADVVTYTACAASAVADAVGPIDLVGIIQRVCSLNKVK